MLLLLLGAGFELLGRGLAGLAILLQASEELALADSLQVQVSIVVLAGKWMRSLHLAPSISQHSSTYPIFYSDINYY